MTNFNLHKFCIAPMLDLTDRHFRFFVRTMSQKAFLYTELISSNALLHNPDLEALRFNVSETPLALQIGVNNPKDALESAILAKEKGFNEININAGCPSPKVKAGNFGASLMSEPKLIASCIKNICKNLDIFVSVKTRIGIIPNDNLENLKIFTEIIKDSGCKTFIIHARGANLNASVKKNLSAPPIRHQEVYRLKEAFPDLEIIINGEIKNLEQAKEHLNYVDGVMLGRSAYANPFMLKDVDEEIFALPKNNITREEIAKIMQDYIIKQEWNSKHITKHLSNLYLGCAKAKNWRKGCAAGKIIIDN